MITLDRPSSVLIAYKLHFGAIIGLTGADGCLANRASRENDFLLMMIKRMGRAMVLVLIRLPPVEKSHV
jgi:hypothetical protein